MGDPQLPCQLLRGASTRSVTELLALRKDALARSEMSSSIPPRHPDFPWRNEEALTFELIYN
jgi:hypothetical protein